MRGRIFTLLLILCVSTWISIPVSASLMPESTKFENETEDEQVIGITTTKSTLGFTIGGGLFKARVDWGDGNLVEYNVESMCSIDGNVLSAEGTVKVYGDSVFIMRCESQEVTDFDLSKASKLYSFYCNGNKLDTFSGTPYFVC